MKDAAEAFLGQPWKSPDSVPLQVLNLGSCLPLGPCAPLVLWRRASDGFRAPMMG